MGHGDIDMLEKEQRVEKGKVLNLLNKTKWNCRCLNFTQRNQVQREFRRNSRIVTWKEI